jgi:hypothetical protein
MSRREHFFHGANEEEDEEEDDHDPMEHQDTREERSPEGR